MTALKQKIEETLSVIRSYTKDNYPIGIILGTGLGGLVKEIKIDHQTKLSLKSFDNSFLNFELHRC